VSVDPADDTPHVKDGKVLTILPMGGRGQGKPGTRGSRTGEQQAYDH
jgi:hypothetical protein